ncbi:MAG: PAS domain S-box protein [Desulfobacterales bacterium]|jgi:PAS domain S-box-containing protein
MADKPTVEELKQRVRELEEKPPGEKQLNSRIRLLLLAIEQSREGVAVSDLDGILEYVNPSFAKAHGYSPEELTGKHLSVFHTTKQMPSVESANQQIKETGSFKGEICHVTRDGIEFPALMHNTLVRDNNGNPIGMAATLHDITELKKYQRAIRESKQEKELILNSMVEHVIHQDTEMRILWANRAACESVNLTPEEIVGRFCYEIWSQRSQPCSDCPVLKAMKTGHTEEKEKYTPDGKSWFVRGHPVRDANGKIVGAIELTLDITERKQAEEALQKAHNQLEQRVKERTRELKAQTQKLEELNTALKVLIDKRDEDKKNLEDNVLTNVNNLILPYLNKLKKSVSDPTQKIYTEVLKTNINEIVSPFANKLSLEYTRLTPAEIRVANLVKRGIRTKSIAKIFGVSVKTIESHRESIRKKLGIKKKKVNLRSHLLSFE